MVLASLTPFSVMAQTYAIRVEFNTNLRAAASLDSAVVQSATAGSILQVVGSFNRWLKINRDGLELWMADWVPYSKVSLDAPPNEIDNYCFTIWQCDTEAEWKQGYFAYQNALQQSSSLPVTQSHSQPAQPRSRALAQSRSRNTISDPQPSTPSNPRTSGTKEIKGGKVFLPFGVTMSKEDQQKLIDALSKS